MITRLYVDGFKSLKDFVLEFQPGLNILVGPNGAGKTNIVTFFEFLAHLMESDASESTSCIGGAGAIFRRVGEVYERVIHVNVSGCFLAEGSLLRRRRRDEGEPDKKFCVYEYSFILAFPESGDSVVFQHQRLRLSRVQTFMQSSEAVKMKRWGVDIVATLQEDGDTEVKAAFADESLLDLPYLPRRRKQVGNEDEEISPEGVIGEIISDRNISLVPAISRFAPSLWFLQRDLTGGQIYNVVPSKLKLPEDSARTADISRDGSGLAATLYALQRRRASTELKVFGHPYHSSIYRYESNALDQVVNYLKLVNSSIEDIRVENDQFENLLRVRFDLHNGDYKVTLPLSLMSDGTLKWLALVTAAITAPSVFCIEEPENYLHPQMQGQIVTILREILFKDTPYSFTIMTTHSETLLNHCRPEELIIVSMRDGRTEAKRCANAVDVSDEISRTGFGLGYYFVSDALSYE